MKFNLVEKARREACALVIPALLIFALTFPHCLHAAQSVTLAWDPSPGSDIAGYNIYYGATSGSYTNRMSVGNVTNATVPALIEGRTYYFAATAVNTSGLESDPSNEVVYTVPTNPGSLNQPPTLNILPDVVINVNASQQTVSLSGITSGSVTEAQPLTVTASSSNPALIPHPVVSYTSPGTTGSLQFAPAPQGFGTATITVTVNDGQSINATISRSFVVTVQAAVEPPPVITAQPVSQSVVAGADVTLTVAAAGTGPLTYQWKKNGVALAGLTQSTLTLSHVNQGHQGNYSVVVSNRGGSATSGNAVLTVSLPLTESLMAGSYSGLFFEPDAVSHLSSGSLTLKTTTSRKFSGSLKCGGKRLSLSGQFDGAGKVTKTIPRRYQNPLTIILQLDPNDQDKLTGTVSDGTFTAELIADRAAFDGRQRLAPQEGRYTLVMPGSDDSGSAPGGDSCGTITVNKAGRVRLAGALADGTKISQSATLSKNGDWPLYVSLYSGQGSILSRLTFVAEPPTDLSGDVVWIKPSLPLARFYPGGFAVEATVSGYSYHRPALGNNVLTLAEAVLSLSGGDLTQTLSAQLLVGPRNRVTDLTGRRFSLTFSPSTGIFSGRVLNPAAMKTLPFRGVVAQGLNRGTGYFSGNGQTGKVSLEAFQP